MKKSLKIFLTITIIFVSHLVSTLAQNPQFLKAQELESQGKLEEAKEIYENLYKSNRNDLYFWKLIRLYESTNDFTALENLALLKLKDQTGHLEARRYLARSYYAQGKRKKAHQILMEIVGENWKDINLVKFVAKEFVNLSEHNDAINVYTRARERMGDSSLFSIEMARIYALYENYILAIEEYLKSLEIANIIYSNIERLIDSALEAEITFEELSHPFVDYLDKNHGSIKAAMLLSDVMYRAGDYDDSYRVLIGPAIETDSPVYIWNLAERLKNDGHSKKAIEVYEAYNRYFLNAPNRVNALMESAFIKAELGEEESAIEDYQILMDEYSGTIHASFAVLKFLELSKDKASFQGYTKSLNDFASTTDFREVAYEAYFLLGETFMRNGILEDAKLAFKNAKMKSRSRNEIYKTSVKFALLHFFEADYGAMSKEIETCVGSLPDGEEINDLLSFKILGMRCSSNEEIAGFNAFSQGHYALFRGDTEAAIENFKEAAKDTSSVVAPYAASAIGKIFKSQRNFSEAVNWYLYAAETSQDTTIHVGAIIEAANISGSELNSRENAKALYLEAITTYPDNVYENELRNKLRAIIEQ